WDRFGVLRCEPAAILPPPLHHELRQGTGISALTDKSLLRQHNPARRVSHKGNRNLPWCLRGTRLRECIKSLATEHWDSSAEPNQAADADHPDWNTRARVRTRHRQVCSVRRPMHFQANTEEQRTQSASTSNQIHSLTALFTLLKWISLKKN